MSKRPCPRATPGQRCGETNTEDHEVMPALWTRPGKGGKGSTHTLCNSSKLQTGTQDLHPPIFQASTRRFPPLRNPNDAKEQVEEFAKHDVSQATLSPNGYDRNAGLGWIGRQLSGLASDPLTSADATKSEEVEPVDSAHLKFIQICSNVEVLY